MRIVGSLQSPLGAAVETGHHNFMDELDLSSSAPQPTTLGEVQHITDLLRCSHQDLLVLQDGNLSAQQALLSRIKRLEEQLTTDFDSRSKPPSSETREQRSMLKQGQALSGVTRTATPCQYLLNDKTLYWASLRNPRLPQPNDAAERALRSHVIYRKLSFTSQSYRGDQFRPMLFSVIETALRLPVRTSLLLREICMLGLRGEPIMAIPRRPDPKVCRYLSAAQCLRSTEVDPIRWTVGRQK